MTVVVPPSKAVKGAAGPGKDDVDVAMEEEPETDELKSSEGTVNPTEKVSTGTAPRPPT
jgi:hypothetical protein